MLPTPLRSFCVLAMFGALTCACATTTTSSKHRDVAGTATVGDPSADLVPVVRYGRYTLVELTPVAAQRDLLLQVIDVSMPDTLQASVGDGLRHVLHRSGYRLCHGRATDALDALPLPAAHYRLGPLLLRDALLTLTGPAWDLQVDDGARQVCFIAARDARDEPFGPPPVPVPDVDAGAETFPLAAERRP